MELPVDEAIRCIIADVLGVEASLIGRGAGMATTPGWDADRHYDIVLGVEKSFGLDFAAAEIDSMTTFPAIVEQVVARMN